MGEDFLSKKNIFFNTLIFSVPAIFFLFNPSKFPADDGFFYPQIAYHVIKGDGFTFNNLYDTNGFHPLWMMVCLIAEVINWGNKQFVLYILWFFQVVFFIGGLYFLGCFLKNSVGRILSNSYLSLVFLSFGTLFLLESHLDFFVISFCLYYLAKEKINYFYLGIIFSLVFLARLDNVFILFFLGIYLLANKISIRNILTLILGFFLLVIPYFLYNYFEFGSIVPISGRIKSNFPNMPSYLELLLWNKVFIIINTFYLFLIILKETLFRRLKFFYGLGALAQIVYNTLFQSQIGQWYYIAQIVVFALLVSEIFNFLKFSQRKIFNVFSVCCVLLLCGVGYFKLTTSMSIANNVISSYTKLEKKDDDLVKKVTQDLNVLISKNKRVFVYDFPGKFAFYSDFEVIPADGLVANKKYFNEISNEKFSVFLKKNNIEYVILPAHFDNTSRDRNFMAIIVNDINSKHPKYFLKNTFSKKVVSQINLSDFVLFKVYENPVKTWQPYYNNIEVYKLK